MYGILYSIYVYSDGWTIVPLLFSGRRTTNSWVYICKRMCDYLQLKEEKKKWFNAAYVCDTLRFVPTKSQWMSHVNRWDDQKVEKKKKKYVILLNLIFFCFILLKYNSKVANSCACDLIRFYRNRFTFLKFSTSIYCAYFFFFLIMDCELVHK